MYHADTESEAINLRAYWPTPNNVLLSWEHSDNESPDIYILKHHAIIASDGLLDYVSKRIDLLPTKTSITLSGPGVSRDNWNIFQVIAHTQSHYYGATILDGKYSEMITQ